MEHLIVIDDTGSPGNLNETRFLKEDRKTLVAVFIHKEIRQALEEILLEIIKVLNDSLGIKELHFKDIVNKNGVCEKLTSDDVLYIIEEIAILFANLDLPFFVQTCHKNTLAENGIIIGGRVIVDNLDLRKSEDSALSLLLARIKEYVHSKYPNELTEIVMDEGRKKRNTTENFNLLNGVSTNSEIRYKSSEDYVLLQVADFFAYAINRTQMALIKDVKTPLDNSLLRLFSFALENQECFGASKVEVDIDTFTKDDYDYLQYTKRQIDGNLDAWKDAQNNSPT